MSMDSLGLPPGFGFYPNDKELLNFYLKPKVFGKELPCEIIVEKQIYGPNSNPWDVLDDLSTSWMIRDNLKTVYVFTPLTKIAAGSNSRGGGGGGVKKENYVKKAGCGTWHGETSREPIMEDDRVIGFRRLLVFQINHVDFCLTNEVDFNKIGHWLMHEYVLCGFEDYALCRITVDMSKIARVKKLCASRICSSIKPKANKKTTAKVSTREASKGTATAKDNIEQVVLNQSFSLASATCVFPNYVHTIVLPLHADVGSFRVEEKECQGFAVSGQALTLEEADQLLMNDTEDFNNLGNFGIDVTSFDFESFLNDESWSELVDKVSNSNNVQTMQNMSCSTALGKRKAFEAQQLCSSKKLCSVHDERFLGTSEGFNSFQCNKLDWRRSPVHVLRAWHCRHSMTAMALQASLSFIIQQLRHEHIYVRLQLQFFKYDVNGGQLLT